MLRELRIRDFAIIHELELFLEPGFVVFTGETGAGKSIIIDAVELLLGGRAESAMVRTDAKAAIIEGTFQMNAYVQHALNPFLEQEGLLDEPEVLSLGREIRLEGRNICRVNGRTVNLSTMRTIGELLVDVHGQSEHLSLLRVREHINLLDRYARAEKLRDDFAGLYRDLGHVQVELAELRQRERDAARKAELLEFQIQEIEAVALRPGEDKELVEERTRLANAEQLATLAEAGIEALVVGHHGERSASDLLGESVASLERLAKVDASMEPLNLEAQALLEQLQDLSKRLRLYREEVEFNPARLDQVEERLGLIRSLERKYGEGIHAVLEQADQARKELETIIHAEERIQELAQREAGLLEQLGDLGEQLSQMRRGAGDQLAEAIEMELKDLQMAGARFNTDFRWEPDPAGAPVGEERYSFGPTGLDQLEFLIAPNPGEGLKPLVKIASGGETSRMMLGLKSVLAQQDRTPTLIFDEIDQGIGGRVGAIVGQKLWGLAASHQVLCVTHLPQLAAFGDQHFKVEKHVEAGRSLAQAIPLSGDKRVAELALMLGGVSPANLESASDLIAHAVETKEAVKVG
ncbi:MAG TPA: DNA repair protein RecN [Anaerolineae bacterium]|nr:DNA repair protein RecN [Anaerolineae bacterium]